MLQKFLKAKQQAYGHLAMSTELSRKSFVHYLMQMSEFFGFGEKEAHSLYDIIAESSSQVTLDSLDKLLNTLFQEYFDETCKENQVESGVKRMTNKDLLRLL